MAAGDASDMAARIRAALPLSWFADTAPVLSGVLAGLGTMWASLFDLLTFARLQTRVSTSTGKMLDILAADYFGTSLPRNSGELDPAYRARILAALIAPKNTRPAVLAAIAAVAPGATLLEPTRTPDTMAYGSRAAGLPNIGGAGGYGAGPRYGSRSRPACFFVDAPAGTQAGPLQAAALGAKSAGVIAWIRIKPS